MSKYFIGTLNPNDLANKGFTVDYGNQTLSQCLQYANLYNEWWPNNYSNNYIAFLQDNPADNSINATGQCYSGTSSYDPVTDNAGSSIGSYQIYQVSGCTDPTCIKNSSKEILSSNIEQTKTLIDKQKKENDELKIRLYAINNNIDYQTASNKYYSELNEQLNKKKKADYQNKLAIYQESLKNIKLANSSSTQLLADKNRLIASTSSNIQTSTEKLVELNDKINNANQNINTNNLEYDQKNQIISIINGLIIVLFILILVMIIYYGAIYAKNNHPDLYNSVNNSFQNMGFNYNQQL
jgi:hypothetical protein